MELTSKPGTGESYSRTPMQTRVNLLNTPITHEECRNFLQNLFDRNILPKDVRIFFGRENDCSWGTAHCGKKELIVNRRCVEVFLHETAHFVTWFYYKDKESHGPTFGKSLDWAIQQWLNMKGEK